ncbi:transmembrane protease serine 12 [Plutella xylostella]|uniref:transmembrane protease serine 12 n=1 Tax=Plutella xylostella TaxID=51655 RepID=UPI002032D072|nr:transmembrane protease serine 12 [Plutella xylostella]
MKWLLLLLFTIFSEATRDHRGRSVNTNATAIFDSFAREPYLLSPMNRKGLSRRLFSTWSRWSECHGGHRTRRKHCLRAEVCGDAMRLEVSSCEDHEDLRRQLHKQKRKENIHRKSGYKQRIQVRQLNPPEPAQRRLRGFSPWSPWSSCSRTCTTVRRRYCRRAATCGRKVIRQSAYCYVEGGYCHRWIRGKMNRRKNPAYTVVDSESMPSPQHAIHPEDARPSPKEPECGRIGRVIGSAARRRIRMHDMMRIIGGRPAPPGKWPWQVAVLNRYKEAFCGGTLISLRWAATAAHCVRARLYVRLGEHDLRRADRGELELRVSGAVLHPHYDPDTVVNDVALLRLPAPARPDLGHGVACLPQGQPLRPRAPCTILGWGKRRATDDHGTRLLYEAQVSTIPQGVCRRSYWQYAITSDMVCAGRGRRDSCAGDSGGPLLCREGDKYYLQGITSFGDGCGKRGKFGIYTRTAGYVTWMKQVMAHKYFDD